MRDPSSISQHGGKANKILFHSMVMAMGKMILERYKIPIMSNIIPLPFESTLSASYADVSELVQVMQRLERHLAHVVNVRVTSKFVGW